MSHTLFQSYLLQGALLFYRSEYQADNSKQEELKNPHLDTGISELEKAILHGKKGHANEATEHAENAVKHLSEVT